MCGLNGWKKSEKSLKDNGVCKSVMINLKVYLIFSVLFIWP